MFLHTGGFFGIMIDRRKVIKLMNAKVFVMTHVPFILPKDDIYVPLRVGSKGQDDFGYQRDDHGDNISEKNHMYSELTGIYDIWKNPAAFGITEDDPDFVIGLCHYRRYFSEGGGRIMTRPYLEKIMSGNDVVTSDRIEIPESFHTYYGICHPIGDLDLCGKVLKELYPDYGKAFDEVMEYRRICIGNLALMRKKVFDAYCEWLFSILFALEEKLDLSGRDAQETRVYGFLSEELLMVYLLKNKALLCIAENKVTLVSEKAETIKLKEALSYLYLQGQYSDAVSLYDEVVRVRPDVLFEASDVSGLLPKMKKLLDFLISAGEEEKATFRLSFDNLKDASLFFDEEGVPPVKKAPIVIYEGRGICYDVLNSFARGLGEALKRCGEDVEYIDLSGENATDKVLSLSKKPIKAVIGFQTKAFSIYLDSKSEYIHDLIAAPKFNYDTDNPIFLFDIMTKCPRDYYILSHDGNYISFIKRYFDNIKDAFLLPPAGTFLPEFTGKSFDEGVGKDFENRPYDVAFLGTFRDYKDFTPEQFGIEEEYRVLSEKYFSLMEKEPSLPPEDALHSIISDDISDSDFLSLFERVCPMVSAVAEEYRRRVIMALLDSGISLHVYGKSWMDFPLKDEYQNLHIHEEVIGDEAVRELSKAKISLNVMFWHKDGFTERVANSMMAGAVLLTDETECIKSQYEDGKEMLIFELSDIDGMAARVKEYLKAPEKLREIAGNGFKRAAAEDTWDERAALFLSYLKECTV